MPTSANLSTQDDKELSKFIKYLTYKSVQVIIQSRLGKKLATSSKVSSTGSDWFNLAITDLPDVLVETKKVVPKALALGSTLCIEISLKTAEGDSMVLEAWIIKMEEPCDATARVSLVIYNRMGLLVKSLMCAARATPAYRLSRSQSSQTYIVCYRIYVGVPLVHQLGCQVRTVNVGSVATPKGTLSMSVIHRTKHLLSPQSSRLATNFKDDHFELDPVIRQATSPPLPCLAVNRRASFVGSPSENCTNYFTNSPPDPSYLACSPKNSSPVQPPPSLEDQTFSAVDRAEKLLDLSATLGAFACKNGNSDGESLTNEEIPFENLLQFEEAQQTEDLKENGETLHSEEFPRDCEPRKMCKEDQEEFILVELKTPFAGDGGDSDLGQFYRECQSAPSLECLDQKMSVADFLSSATQQLNLYEACSDDFNQFLRVIADPE